MNFNFSETTGLGTTGTSQLEGDRIHTVKFDGCEATDYKDGQYKVLRIKFSNNEGTFTHTIFEPRPEDLQDTQGAYGPNPSNMKCMITTLRHLAAAVSPKLQETLNKLPDNMSWDQFRNQVVEASKDGIGVETKIKLFKRERTDVNTGEKRVEAEFPRYILSYDREGKLYMRTNFIGNNTHFTTKELTDMQKRNTAVPTPVEGTITSGGTKLADPDFDEEL